MSAHGFAKKPLGTMPIDGAGKYFLSRNKTHPGLRKVGRTPFDGKFASRGIGAFPKDGGESLFVGEAKRRRQHRCEYLSSKLFTSLCAAALDDILPVFGGHTLAEAVLLLAL